MHESLLTHRGASLYFVKLSRAASPTYDKHNFLVLCTFLDAYECFLFLSEMVMAVWLIVYLLAAVRSSIMHVKLLLYSPY